MEQDIGGKGNEVNSDVKRDTKENELMQPWGELHSIIDNSDRLKTG